MKTIRIEYRPMPTLTKAEIEHLRFLTIVPPEEKRSLFKYWLDHFSHLDLLHTAIVTVGNKIVGWAAANMGESWNLGMVGGIY